MSHPQDPYQPHQEPTAPIPQWPADPTAPQPPASGGQYPPPPVSGAPYQPTSGSPYAPQQPGAYPPPGTDPGYQPGAFQAPSGNAPGYQPGAYPPPPGTDPAYQPYAPGGPGQQFGPPQPPPKSNKKMFIIIGAVVAVLALLCCVGGIAFAVRSIDEAAEETRRQLPGTSATPFPGSRPTGAPSSSGPNSENFNLKAGQTLTVTDEDGTLELTVLRFRTSAKGCKEYSPAPDKGLYLIADVSATVTKGNMSINPFHFKWVGDDGTTSTGIAGAFAGCGDLLDSGTNLREGSKRSGSVTFDVANQNGAMEYQYQLETQGSWKP